MTPLEIARRVLRTPATDDAIIAAADIVMTYGMPLEWWTANELRREALRRQQRADAEAWLETAVIAKIEAAKRTAYPLAFVDAPRKGLIRSQLPACAGFVGFALAVVLGRV